MLVDRRCSACCAPPLARANFCELTAEDRIGDAADPLAAGLLQAEHVDLVGVEEGRPEPGREWRSRHILGADVPRGDPERGLSGHGRERDRRAEGADVGAVDGADLEPVVGLGCEELVTNRPSQSSVRTALVSLAKFLSRAIATSYWRALATAGHVVSTPVVAYLSTEILPTAPGSKREARRARRDRLAVVDRVDSVEQVDAGG